MSRRLHASEEHGFTLIEVLVAVAILLVGVLGVVTLVDGANAVTSKTKAREGGTNVARSIIEVSRSVRYRDLTAQELLDGLNSRPGLVDVKPAQAGYTIRSRNVDYELTLTVCSMDDPQDNLGTHIGPVAYCTDSDALPAGQSGQDRNPDDYKRVRVTLNWSTRGVGQSITQTSALINPVGGLGPSVTSLRMTSPTSNSDPLQITSDLVHEASFEALTSATAAGVNWSVGGEPMGKASGSGLIWNFTWELDRPNGDIAYHDCTYVVQADAYDASDRAGAPRAVTVVLNRRAPVEPEGFGGGRNGSGNYVDLQWLPNPECDIRGYRVYRSSAAGTLGSATTCLGEVTDITQKVDCTDDPPAGEPTSTRWWGSMYLPAAAPRVRACPATRSPWAPRPKGRRRRPVSWDPSTDPDGIQFYRIYRDGTTYANRHDDYFPSAQNPGYAWFEFDTVGAPHTYRVSAVDGSFAESDLSGPVTGG